MARLVAIAAEKLPAGLFVIGLIALTPIVVPTIIVEAFGHAAVEGIGTFAEAAAELTARC